ncbi:MAG: hypothetical protein JWM34_3272 [Ilumatobacteraceae bacterium]|nr:hypothetical protein [Ilumatobacteraceae bacterium]
MNGAQPSATDFEARKHMMSQARDRKVIAHDVSPARPLHSPSFTWRVAADHRGARIDGELMQGPTLSTSKPSASSRATPQQYLHTCRGGPSAGEADGGSVKVTRVESYSSAVVLA